MNFDFLRAIVWDINSRLEVWQDIGSKAIMFRNQKGEILEISYRSMTELSQQEIMRLVINHIAGEVSEAAARYVGDGNTVNQRRIIQINNELDIIRGVVPTPKGYVIDIKKAKRLMEELKTLMEAGE